MVASGVHRMDPAGVVGHVGHLFVLERAAGERGKLGAVVPHRLGDDAAVVGEHPFVDQDEILRVEGGSHQEDPVEGYFGHDEERRGIQAGQRHAFAGAGFVVGLEAEGVHGLHGFGFPVGNDVGVELIQPEMAADVHVEVILVAFIAEESIRFREHVDVDELPETVNLGLFIGKSPGLEV